jgi:Trk K+ transport system NAD-binding subunit
METENLLDAGANIVENPLAIISYQIDMALNSPSLFKLENWLYNIDTLDCRTFSIPKDQVIICGYGRLGKSLYEVFVKNGVKPVVIEINNDVAVEAINNGIDTIVCGNAEDRILLEKLHIKTMNSVIVATNDDTTNLSIVSTIRSVNRDIIIIARENELSDFSIFASAKIDHIFLPQEILIHKTTNAIINPLSDKLIRLLESKEEVWGQQLLSKLIKEIGINPITYEFSIDKVDAIELYNYLLKSENTITFNDIKKSRRDRTQYNNLVPLLVTRHKEDIILPLCNTELKIGDKILIACDQNSKEDVAYIMNNVYEFHYIITGQDKTYFNKFISRS